MNRAFTLIELLVVIAIIGILSAVVLASVNVARENGRLAAGKQFEQNVYHAIGYQEVGQWDFDEASGATALDSSGQVRTVRLTGLPLVQRGLRASLLYLTALLIT